MEERQNNGNVLIHICGVLDYPDPYESNRIKVRLPYIDSGLNDDELPWCSPIMPKLMHVVPKKGETVIIIMEREGSRNDNRFYAGPVISQQYFNSFDPFISTALSGLTDAKLNMFQAPSKNPENNGIVPEENDVAIIGRENTDMILKPKEILIRCGIKNSPNSNKIESRLEANLVDPAYIQMVYAKNAFTDNSNSKILDKTYSSVINVVADRINLLSRTSKDPYNLYAKMLYNRETENGNTKSSEIESVVNTAHPLVYGDELVAYLKELVQIFRTHTHPFSMLPPTINGTAQEFLSKDTDSMLSKAIKIN